jgi:hypothetical protein
VAIALSIIIGSAVLSGSVFWLATNFGQWTESNDRVLASLARVEQLLAVRPIGDSANHVATFVSIDEDLDLPPREESA